MATQSRQFTSSSTSSWLTACSSVSAGRWGERMVFESLVVGLGGHVGSGCTNLGDSQCSQAWQCSGVLRLGNARHRTCYGGTQRGCLPGGFPLPGGGASLSSLHVARAETTGSQDEMPLNSSRSLAEGNSGMRCEVKNLMFFSHQHHMDFMMQLLFLAKSRPRSQFLSMSIVKICRTSPLIWNKAAGVS